MTPKYDTFLHPVCRAHACEDCRLQAEEYTTLLEQRTMSLWLLEQENERLKREADLERQRAEHWREMSQLALPEAIRRWQEWEVNQAMKKGRAQERRRLAQYTKKLREIEQQIKKTKGKVQL